MDERLRKEELYRTLLSASVELFTTGDGAPFVVESQRAWLYASDEVLEDINVYLKAFSAYADAKQRKADIAGLWTAVLKAEGRLRLSIRKDLQPKTQITAEWVKREWEMITSRPERIRRYLGRESASSKKDKTI
ncbi:MAG: hypothetical protein HYR76_10270 [Ignavibacteria bacterium]|nr:hypothetical protein [Ignavibacteria bacterium]